MVPTTEGPVLRIAHLTKRFPLRIGSFRRGMIAAVDDVSLGIWKGETVGLVGESGCGKSTVGRCVLHLLRPDAGTIEYRGVDITQLSERRFYPFRKRIQVVFQNPRSSFNPVKAVRTTVSEALELLDLGRRAMRQECDRLFEEVGLRAEFGSRLPGQLSGGQLQRVAVARAIAVRPEFIFLDEPTASLDMSIRGQVTNLLLELQERTDTSYLLVSHDLRVVRAMADRLMVMYLGQVVEEAPREEMFANCLHPYTKTLLAATRVGQEAPDHGRAGAFIRGEVVRILETSEGCKLCNRCLLSSNRCESEMPPLVENRLGHRVRCWHAADEGTSDGQTGSPSG